MLGTGFQYVALHDFRQGMACCRGIIAEDTQGMFGLEFLQCFLGFPAGIEGCAKVRVTLVSGENLEGILQLLEMGFVALA